MNHAFPSLNLTAVVHLTANGLLDVTARGTLILLLAGALCWAGKRLAAADRHRIWFLALLVAALLPGWTVLHRNPLPPPQNPRINLGIHYDLPPQRDGVAPQHEVPGSPGSSTVDVMRPESSRSALRAGTGFEDMPGRFPTSVRSIGLGNGFEPFTVRAAGPWSQAVVIVWLVGLLIVLSYLGLGRWALARLRRNARALEEPRWIELLVRSARDLGIRRHVRLLQTPDQGIPVTWGSWRPVILLPESATHWSDERRRAVLMHELGHIGRWDCLTQQIAEVLGALLWFHPMAWYAIHRMRLEREFACDDLVLSRGWKASDYAEQLINLAQLKAGITAPGTIAMARPARLGTRIRAILDSSRRRRPMTPIRFAAVALLLLAGGEALPRPLALAESVAARSESKPSEATVVDAVLARQEPGIQRIRAALQQQQDKVESLEAALDKIREASRISDLTDGLPPAVERDRFPDDSAVLRIENLRSNLQSEAARSHAKLEQLHSLDRDALLSVLLTLQSDDQLLQHLSIAHATAEVDLETAEARYGKAGPETVRAQKTLDLLTRKLDDRLKGIMQALKIQQTALRDELSLLEKELGREKDENLGQAKAFQEYFRAKRLLENERLLLDVLQRKLAQAVFDADVPRSTGITNRPVLR